MCRQCLDYVWNIHLGVYPHCWTSVSPAAASLFVLVKVLNTHKPSC